MEASRQGPLRRLAELADRDFPNLFAARDRTASGLRQRRDALGALSHDAGASIVLSWEEEDEDPLWNLDLDPDPDLDWGRWGDEEEDRPFTAQSRSETACAAHRRGPAIATLIARFVATIAA